MMCIEVHKKQSLHADHHMFGAMYGYSGDGDGDKKESTIFTFGIEYSKPCIIN